VSVRSPRRGLASIATVAVLAAAAVLAAGPHGERPARSGTPPLGRPIRADGPHAATSSPSAAPLTVLQASEAFAAGYAALLRGGEPAAALPYASPSLRARLSLLYPQVPAGSRSSAQLTGVRVGAVGRATATSSAVIEDRGAINALTMRLARRAGGWVVVDLAETG
jgi:hypothetical protein